MVRSTRSRAGAFWIPVLLVGALVVAGGKIALDAYDKYEQRKREANLQRQLDNEKRLREAAELARKKAEMRASLLQVKERRGELMILSKKEAPDSPGEYDIEFVFRESLRGRHADLVRGTVRGTKLHVEGRTIVFKDDLERPEIPHVLVLDAIRATGPAGSRTPNQVVVVDPSTRTMPEIYRQAGVEEALNNLGLALQSEPRFWDLMHDEQARQKLGILLMDAPSNRVEPRERRTYAWWFTRTGGVHLDVPQEERPTLPANTQASAPLAHGNTSTRMSQALATNGRPALPEASRGSLLGMRGN